MFKARKEVRKEFPNKNIVLCYFINCPYGNAEDVFSSFDEGIKYATCKTGGFVEENGLIKKVEEIKAIRV